MSVMTLRGFSEFRQVPRSYHNCCQDIGHFLSTFRPCPLPVVVGSFGGLDFDKVYSHEYQVLQS